MKKIFAAVLLVGFLNAVTATAGTRFDAKTWNGIQTYDARALSKSLGSHVGQLVTIKFTFRGKDIHHLKPSWYESAIWQPDPKGHKGFSDVRVMVAKKDLDAFKSITTDSSSATEMTVYGRVLRDAEANFLFVRLLGRNTVSDPAGNTVVSW